MIHDQTCLRFFPFFSPTLFPFRQDSQMKLRFYTRLCIYFTEYLFGNDAARYPSLSLLFPVSHAMSAFRCCGKSFSHRFNDFIMDIKAKGVTARAMLRDLSRSIEFFLLFVHRFNKNLLVMLFKGLKIPSNGLYFQVFPHQ